jgi:hypothetical protein
VIRAHLGIALLDLLYVGLGAAIVLATGLRVPGRLRFAGLSLAVGWAAFASIASLALIAGLSLAVWQIVLLCVAAIAAAVACGATRPPSAASAPEPPERGWRRWLGLGGAVALGSYVGLLVLRSLFAPADVNYDTWAFWIPKAEAITFFGGLDTGPGGFTAFDNPEYPPASPALAAAVFRFAGGIETAALPFQNALLGAAFFVAAAALLGRRVPGWIVWPSLLALALAPSLGFDFEAALADLPVAYLVGLGAVCCALWLLEETSGSLPLAAVFLAAASFTKTEGFMLSVLLVIALALATLVRARRRRPLLLLGAAPILALVAWKLWLAANDQQLESVLYSASDALHPTYLADRIDRLTYAAGQLLGLVFDPGRWLLIAPLALLTGALALVRRTELGVFYLSWLGLGFAGLTGVYWISNVDVRWHVDTSASRVCASLLVFAGVLLPLLLAELGRRPREP